MQLRNANLVGISLMFLALAGLFVPSAGPAFGADDAKSTTPPKSAVASATQLAAVTAADDARIAAMAKPQLDRLDALFSKDLHYAHSTGTVDTKSSLIELLTSGKAKYLGFEYEKRDFTFPASDIALMTGRVKIRVSTPQGDQASVLSFLAVWRLESGNWRFLAWQSCKIPPAQ